MTFVMYWKNNMRAGDRPPLALFLYPRHNVSRHFAIQGNFNGETWKLLEVKKQETEEGTMRKKTEVSQNTYSTLQNT